MGDFVVDLGILKLRDQINILAPNRRKGSDGAIGDAAHQARASDHNPEHPAPAGNPDYQVDAGDFTHDPANGADMGKISEAIRLSKDRRVAYVIFNRRITGPNHSWRWDTYTGSDPHDGHMHVSVNDSHHDETQDWQITLPGGGGQSGGSMSVWEEDVVPNRGSDQATNEFVRPKWALTFIWEHARDASVKADSLLAQSQANGASLSQLKAKFDAGMPVVIDYDILAQKTADIILAHLGQEFADRVRAELNSTRLTAG